MWSRSVCASHRDRYSRFADETFSEEHKPTLLVEYRHRFVDTLKSRCKVQIWDCLSSGQANIMTSIYRGAHGVVLLYDVMDPESLVAAPDWLKEIMTYSTKQVVVYLVGTKTDIPHRRVSIVQGQGMAKQMGVKYFEVSSKTGENVDSLFCKIVNDLKDVNALSMAASTRSPSSTPQHSRQDPTLLGGGDADRANSSAPARDDEKRKCCTLM